MLELRIIRCLTCGEQPREGAQRKGDGFHGVWADAIFIVIELLAELSLDEAINGRILISSKQQSCEEKHSR